jgi:hypothetical protein
LLSFASKQTERKGSSNTLATEKKRGRRTSPPQQLPACSAVTIATPFTQGVQCSRYGRNWILKDVVLKKNEHDVAIPSNLNHDTILFSDGKLFFDVAKSDKYFIVAYFNENHVSASFYETSEWL